MKVKTLNQFWILLWLIYFGCVSGRYLENTDSQDERSCLAFKDSPGKHKIIIPNAEPFDAVCTTVEKFGSGWMVLMNNTSGNLSINRNWNDYRDGFGSLDGEHFLGLTRLHHLTNSQPHELIIIYDLTGEIEHFNRFRIGNEEEQFKMWNMTLNEQSPLHIINPRIKDRKFSTFDRNNQGLKYINIAEYRGYGWWFHDEDIQIPYEFWWRTRFLIRPKQ